MDPQTKEFVFELVRYAASKADAKDGADLANRLRGVLEQYDKEQKIAANQAKAEELGLEQGAKVMFMTHEVTVETIDMEKAHVKIRYSRGGTRIVGFASVRPIGDGDSEE